MDQVTLDTVYAAFLAFHAHFAPSFGRKQWRHRAKDYLQALIVQAEERSNAENLSEVVDASPRVLQRFLTEASWDDAAVTEQLQRYLGPRLKHQEAVFALDDSGVPKQGKKSVGVAPQYCGVLGKVANCQVGVYLAYLSPKGRALVDKRLYLPKVWTQDSARCRAAGVPEEAQTYQSKTALALELLKRAKKLGHLTADWVTGDDAFGACPQFRDGVEEAGYLYVLEVPCNTPVWPLEPTWETPVGSGFGRPPGPRPVEAERKQVKERAAALPESAWEVAMVAEGSQGPRLYRFARERVRESRDEKPGGVLWLIHRRNLDGSEPRYYFSNAPEETPGSVLFRVSGARWPIETEFQTNKSYLGLDEYEVRSWKGWHHHITLCLLASAFLLSLQQEWGEKGARDHTSAGVSAGARVIAAAALQQRGAIGMVGGDAGAQRPSEALARQATSCTGPYLTTYRNPSLQY